MGDAQFFNRKTLYDREQITVSTAVAVPTEAKVRNTAGTRGAFKASAAILEVISEGIIYTLDGSTPTSTNGNRLVAGDVLPIAGQDKVRQLKMIRSGATNAVVDVSYYHG